LGVSILFHNLHRNGFPGMRASLVTESLNSEWYTRLNGNNRMGIMPDHILGTDSFLCYIHRVLLDLVRCRQIALIGKS